MREVARGGRLVRFLLRPAPLGIVSMLLVSGVAIAVFAGPIIDLTLFCSGGVVRGANIDTALVVAFFGGLAEALLIAVAARVSGYILAAALLLGAATVGAALAFVAADSATYIQDNRYCTTFFVPPPVTFSPRIGHFGYLYVLWGVPLGVLLSGAVWTLRNARRSRR